MYAVAMRNAQPVSEENGKFCELARRVPIYDTEKGVKCYEIQTFAYGKQ